MSTAEARNRGNLLQVARKKAKMRQADLADAVGVSAKTIHNLEHGEHSNPSTLAAVMRVLGLTETDLTEAPQPEPVDQAELAALKRYPRGVFVALMVWGAMLSGMPEDEQDERIGRVSRYLAQQSDDLP